MAYDHELTLIGTAIKKDDIEQDIEVKTHETILCDLKSIGRNEFYSAAQAGLRPSLTFGIHKYEYNGEKKVKFEGQEYKVLRTYSEDFEEIELICERIGANG